MRKIFFSAALLSAAAAYGQDYKGRVGINTTTPATTLDVTGKPDDAAVLDGLVAPRLTGTQLAAKTYAAQQTGSLVYVTEAASSLSGQVINVSSPGYYYFDGSVWVMVSPNDWHTTGNAGTVPGTNFLGTTDDKALMFKVNNTKSGYIDNKTNDGNTGIGYNTMTGSSFSTPGSALNNIALGSHTLSSATSGYTWSNIAIGNNAMKSATDPRFNTAVGADSMNSLTTGRNNVGVGISTLGSVTTGGLNTAVGGTALGAATTGTANNALGLNALHQLTTGHANIGIGQLAGYNLTDGSYNIVIGNYNNPILDPHGNQQLNIGDLIYGTGLSTGVFSVIGGTTSYSAKRVGIAVTAQPTSTLQINGSFSAPARKHSGTVTETDYTIFGTGDCTLPDPAAMKGRIYNFVYDGTPFIINGSIRMDGTVSSSYTINNTGSLKRLTVQSDGNNWVVIY